MSVSHKFIQGYMVGSIAKNAIDRASGTPRTQQTMNYGIIPQKSIGTSLILTLFLGSLGLFYSAKIWAIVLFIINTFLFCFTFGLSTIITRPITMTIGYVTTHNYNVDRLDEYHRWYRIRQKQKAL